MSLLFDYIFGECRMIDCSFPLTDLHRHLDGNIRASTILELGQKYNMSLPADSLETLIPYVQVVDTCSDLVTWLKMLDWGVAVLGSYDDCRRVAYENMEDARQAGLNYTELRFSPHYMAATHRLQMEGVIEAVIDGVKAGEKDFGVTSNLIGIMSRTQGVEACYSELQACLHYKDALVAMDLAGDEQGFPGSLFVEHFKKVRDAGLNVTVHAGEAGGAESIWQAVKELGATRIGHGVRAIDDPVLMDYLAKHRIGIESCLTSNVQTNTVPSLQEHPISAFLKKGMLVTLNTDDPAVEGIDLSHEYEKAAPAAGLDSGDIRDCQKNGLAVAFLTDQEKQDILRQISR
ncbi:Aminodeoxyfutalosine deaminase [invertebrate metagenome]|uniref:adenosine deaminase n=1 Tax=invertebrate metagenome TaxID=1711999 RepID=A0A2H9T9D5_9ZZZZ